MSGARSISRRSPWTLVLTTLLALMTTLTTLVLAHTPRAVTAVMRDDLGFFDDAERAHGADDLKELLDARESDRGYTAVMVAVLERRERALERLLELGADATIDDHDGHTPVNAAALMGDIAALKTLRAHGVDVRNLARDGFSPLHRASWGGAEAHESAVRYLVEECGVDVDQRDVSGGNALFRALERDNVFMVEVLLKLGADPNFKTKRGDSLLATAVRKQNAKAVSRLLDAGADVMVNDSKGRNLRKLAKRLRSKKVLELISNAYSSRQSVRDGGGEL